MKPLDHCVENISLREKKITKQEKTDNDKLSNLQSSPDIKVKLMVNWKY